MDATDTLHEIAVLCDGLSIRPQRVEVSTTHTGAVHVNIRTVTRADLWALCDATKTKRPAPAPAVVAPAGDMFANLG